MFKNCLERLRRLPFRMLWRKVDAVECKGKLKIDRLFGPERAVVIEGGDTLFDRYEAGTALVVTCATKSVIAFFTAL